MWLQQICELTMTDGVLTVLCCICRRSHSAASSAMVSGGMLLAPGRHSLCIVGGSLPQHAVVTPTSLGTGLAHVYAWQPGVGSDVLSHMLSNPLSVCCSSAGAPAALANPPNPLLVSFVEALFKFPPLFDSATKKV